MSNEIGNLLVKWSGNEYVIDGLTVTDTVIDFKRAIYKTTNVKPDKQKLLGLKHKGHLAADDVRLGDLRLRPGMKILMMGTRDEELAQVLEPPPDLPEVFNDFDIPADEEVAVENRHEFLEKVERRIQTYKITELNEPRPNKKLLVLDIDYTLFDHRSVAETAETLMRPFLHEFLGSAYEDYDIVIWSATSMKWIEAKMQELGVTSNTNYKICFMLDSAAMISVYTTKYGVIEVKPLGLIWGKYQQWSSKDTIMFDDCRHNFLMNPQNGLKIAPFKNAHLNRSTDRELLKLSKYLKTIASLDDLSSLDHRSWHRNKGHKWHVIDSVPSVHVDLSTNKNSNSSVNESKDDTSKMTDTSVCQSTDNLINDCDVENGNKK